MDKKPIYGQAGRLQKLMQILEMLTGQGEKKKDGLQIKTALTTTKEKMNTDEEEMNTEPKTTGSEIGPK